MMVDKVTVIPPDAIIALSKTHTLFQNDKIILSEEAAILIANTIEFRIKQIIQMARRFMTKSIRPTFATTLLPSDVRNALRTLNMKDLEGYSNCYDYRYVWATKLYKGDRVIKRESCYRNSLGEKCWGRYRLTEVVQQDMQKPVPAAPGLTVHWMVVNGKVPIISSNLGECITDEFQKRMQNLIIKEEISNINYLDYSDTIDSIDNINTLLTTFKHPDPNLKTTLNNNNIEKGIFDAINKQIIDDKNPNKQNKIIIPKIDHLLTKEHRFFLKEIRNTIRRASYTLDNDIHTQFKKVVGILKSSLALDQLLPELCHFFVTEMARYKSNPSSMSISILLEYVEAITSNPNLQLHHHIHQLLIPLLEILLGPDEPNPSFIYRGLLLRRYAAQSIGNIASNLRNFRNGLENIDNYLMSLYKSEILNENCSLSILYGALCGISKLPLTAKRIIFYPMVPLLLYVVIKKQMNIYKNFIPHNNNQYKIQQFKIIICQEIIHLIMAIIYDAGFEDVLSTLDDTGIKLTISQQAKTMVNETLLGCVNSSINPECFLPVYTAILCKCYSALNDIDPITSIKRKYSETTDENVDVNKKNIIPEIENIKRYMILYNKANNNSSINIDDSILTSKNNTTLHKHWYNNQAIHSLTLLI